jgi:hypothetical protein
MAPNWRASEAFMAAHVALTRACRRALIAQLQVVEVDRALAAHGGDPLRTDWRQFRPLALGREEAWSDWLAHLVQHGDHAFLTDLFGLRGLPASPPIVAREQPLIDPSDRSQGNYRSDMILEWPERCQAIHVEIKVGDPHLAKTWDEAARLQSTHGGTWYHFLIVLPNQLESARRVKETNERRATDRLSRS